LAAVAFHTRMGNDLALSATSGARRHADETTERCFANASDLASTVTLRANRGPVAGFGSGPVTPGTGFNPHNLNFTLRTEGSFVERQLDFTHYVAARTSAAGAGLPHPATKKRPE